MAFLCVLTRPVESVALISSAKFVLRISNKTVVSSSFTALSKDVSSTLWPAMAPLFAQLAAHCLVGSQLTLSVLRPGWPPLFAQSNRTLAPTVRSPFEMHSAWFEGIRLAGSLVQRTLENLPKIGNLSVLTAHRMGNVSKLGTVYLCQ